MTEFLGAPVHPMLVHFPIGGMIFGAGALLVSLFVGKARRAAWVRGAALLLAAAVVGGLVAVWTGHEFAESLGFLPHGEWIPPAAVKDGLLRRHVLFAGGGAAAAAVAAVLAAFAGSGRRSPVPAFIAAAVAAALISIAGHAGGTMVYNAPTDESGAPIQRSR